MKFMLTALLFTFIAAVHAESEWIDTKGNLVEGVKLYGAQIDDEEWYYGTVLCYGLTIDPGTWLIKKKRGDKIWIDPLEHAVLLNNLWIKKSDPALVDRNINPCPIETGK